jgi:hypothetical protein
LLRSPQPLLRVSILLALAWAAAGLARETGAVVAALDEGQPQVPVCNWRFGMAPVERLRRTLRGVEGWLPRDSIVAFTSPAGEYDAEFYRWRWAAYLLPDLDVVPPEATAVVAAYAVAYRRLPLPLRGCRLDLIRDLDGGRLYQVLRP